MKHILRAFIIALLALAAPLQASVPANTSTWIGANYTPAYAANQIQMWHEFKPEVIDRELAAAVQIFRHQHAARLPA